MTADLLPLSAIEGLDAPCRRHPAEPELADALAPDSGACFAAMASRAFPESDLATVVLFGQWLGWLAAFDDHRDEGSLGRDLSALDSAFRPLIAATSPPHLAGGSHAAMRASAPAAGKRLAAGAHPQTQRVGVFAGLWEATAGRVGDDWRRRFHRELRKLWHASREELVNRRQGRIPSPSHYVRLRRITNGALLFLLPEAMLKVEIPWAVSHTPAWRELIDACNDVTAWCNDLASAAKESTGNEVHNFVFVLAQALQISREAGARRVCERIAARMLDLRAAARALPSTFDKVGLDRRTACDVSRVAVTLLGAPRGHLEWLQESARYHIRTG